MNALASQIMGQQVMRSPAMEVYKAVQTASNSDMMLRQQLANLPNGKKVLEILDQCGGNYEQAAKMSMKVLGIDLNDLASLARSMGL